jgi:hypothetical protein
MFHPHLVRVMAALVLAASCSGCANDLMRTDIVRPVEVRLSYYKAVEVPAPVVPKGLPQIGDDLQQRLINELLSLGKFKQVGPAAEGEDDTLVVQATVKKWDEGSAFLRWWGSVLDFGSNMYEQYTKQQLSVAGNVGDGYLVVDFKFLDKHTKDVLGQISVRGLCDDPDTPRPAEDRVVHSLAKYVKARLEPPPVTLTR